MQQASNSVNADSLPSTSSLEQLVAEANGLLTSDASDSASPLQESSSPAANERKMTADGNSSSPQSHKPTNGLNSIDSANDSSENITGPSSNAAPKELDSITNSNSYFKSRAADMAKQEPTSENTAKPPESQTKLVESQPCQPVQPHPQNVAREKQSAKISNTLDTSNQSAALPQSAQQPQLLQQKGQKTANTKQTADQHQSHQQPSQQPAQRHLQQQQQNQADVQHPVHPPQQGVHKPPQHQQPAQTPHQHQPQHQPLQVVQQAPQQTQTQQTVQYHPSNHQQSIHQTAQQHSQQQQQGQQPAHQPESQAPLQKPPPQAPSSQQAGNQPPQQQQQMAQASQLHHPQQTSTHQPIPSVVTLPAEPQASQSVVTTPTVLNDPNERLDVPFSSNQQMNVAQPHLQTLQHPQEQIIGMMGTVPIMKIQGATVHYVKKKRGRFKLLQETRPVAPNSLPPRTTAAIPVAGMMPQSHMAAQPHGAATGRVPNNIDISTPQGHSGASVVSVLSSTGPSQFVGNQAQGPQTFDGTSAPTIKKKGRFVVTNVRNPGSIQSMQNRQTLANAPTEVPAQLQAPQLPTMVQQQPSQPTAPQQVQMQQPSMDAETGQQSIQSIAVPAFQTTSPFFSLQGTALLTESFTAPMGTMSTPPLNQQQPLYLSQFQRPPPAPQRPPEVIDTSAPIDAPQNPQSSTPPQTPATVPAPAGTNVESPRRTKPPNTKPAGEGPKSTEKPRKQQNGAASRKVPVHTRSRAQSGTFGLGKLCYLLDQMKSEVTDADQLVRSLQTDMKVLRDKNKELEAKNIDLERGLKEEKSLREKAETRNIELRKKMRQATVQVGAPSRMTIEQTTDDGIFPHTNGAVPTKSDELSTVGPNSEPKTTPSAASGNLNAAAPSPATGSSMPQSGQLPMSSGGMKNPLPPTNGAMSTTPKKSNLPPKKRTPRAQDEASGWHARSSSLGQESDYFLHYVTGDSINSSPAKMNAPGMQQRNVPAPTAVTRSASVASQPGGMQQALKFSSMQEFDPLRRTQSTPSNIPSDMVPVISIPTQVSLVDGTPTVFQNVVDPAAYSAYNGTLSTQFDQNGFVTENNFVFPLTVGMTSSMDQQTVSNGAQEPSVGSGLHGYQQQSFMVVPQQQHIMVQEVGSGVQQVSSVITGQLSQPLPTNQGSFPQYTNPMMQQPQYQAQPQQGCAHSTDSFDPLK